jgi:hypothetical protein
VAPASRPTTLPARLASLPFCRAKRRAALALAASLLLALVCASPAPALVTEISGTSIGLQPRVIGETFDGELGASFNNPNGNPVLHSSRVYAIYWDPTAHYHGDWQHVINQFLTNLAGASGSRSSVFAVDEQYSDSSNQPASYSVTFRGAYTDTKPYPTAGCSDPKPLGLKDRITCLSDQQLQEELASFIGEHSLEKGMGTIFYLLTPPGVTVCVGAGGATGHCSDYTGKAGEESYSNSFCSYHSAINPTSPTTGDGNTVLYAAIPWTAGGYGDPHLEAKDETPGFDCQNGGPIQQEPNQVPCPSPDGGCDLGLADLIISQIGVEQQNLVTDPLLNAWKDSSHREVTDECRNFFLPTLTTDGSEKPGSKAGVLYNQVLSAGSYYINDAFNAAALSLPYPAIPCVTGVRLVPQFTSPSTVNSGDIVAFDGMESLIDLSSVVAFGASAPTKYATYTWNFGDGTPPVSGYAPGAPACTVPWLSPCAASVLHSYQYGGTYSVSLAVTDAVGKKVTVVNPIVVLGPAPPAAHGSGSGSGTGAGFGPPPPSASVAVLSRSLRQVLRSGLLITYSVGERVTGRFEVMLDKKVGHKLHLRAPAATGLAQGTPAQMVIGKSILVTLGGGQSRMRIQLPGSITSRLAHLHSVALILRLVVRNAAGGEATIVTPLKLSH